MFDKFHTHRCGLYMIGFTVKCTVGVIECTIEWVVDYNPLHHALATAVRDNVTTNIDRTPTSITGRNSTRYVYIMPCWILLAPLLFDGAISSKALLLPPKC